MKFVYPEILWALFALIVPILVHLFNFRKFKKVAFSNVSFLKEVKQETQSKSKIKQLLILLARMLALTAIILAFAQPFFPVQNQNMAQGQKLVSLYIDNSFSMETENADGRLLDLAKNKADEIVEYYNTDDRFQLITNDFEGRHQHLVSKDEMLDLIEAVEISPVSLNVGKVFKRQKDLLTEGEFDSKTAFLLTDLQKNTHVLDDFITQDSSISVRFVPTISVSSDNVFIDSVWFSTPVRSVNQPEELHVRIRNTGEEDLENTPIKLTVNGVQKALGSYQVDANDVVDTAIYFTHTLPGIKKCKISITDHPVTFDDDFYLAYNVAQDIEVMEIRGRERLNKAIEKVFSGDEFFHFSSTSFADINYSELSKNNLIILNELNTISSGLADELEKFMADGGTVWVIPSSEINIPSYSQFFGKIGTTPWTVRAVSQTKVSYINLTHPLYQGVFEEIPNHVNLPEVNMYFASMNSSKSGEKHLLSLQNGSSLLSEFEVGSGKLYTLNTSLDSEAGNFSQHALFVTSALRIAEFSQSQSPLYYTIGKDEKFSISNPAQRGETSFHIVDSLHHVDFIPAYRNLGGKTELFVHGQVKNASTFDLTQGNERICALAFNYSREESYTEKYTPEEFQKKIDEFGLINTAIIDSSPESLQQQIGELNEGKKLWYMLVVAALVFLALEMLLIKYWR